MYHLRLYTLSKFPALNLTNWKPEFLGLSLNSVTALKNVV